MTVKEDTQALSRARGTLHADGVQTGTSPERGTWKLPGVGGPPTPGKPTSCPHYMAPARESCSSFRSSAVGVGREDMYCRG